jgi:outer membrane protein
MMKTFREIFALLTTLAALTFSATAQTLPSAHYIDQIFHPPRSATRVPGSQGIEDLVAGGKLTLNLEQTVRLMLLNNTELRINQLQFQQSLFAIQKAYSPFDPVLISSFSPQRNTSPSTSSLIGAATLSSLSQPTSAAYSQTFQTGTNLNISFNTLRSTTNSSFATFNPSFSSGTSFALTQPLLRGRSLSINRAPIVIAQRNVNQSRANFETQINEAILNVINQYWALVEARKNLEVLRDSLKLGEESYKRDKRALELGALSPLEIYRSEGTVAQRKLAVIQAEYAIRPLEDQLRRAIGADLDHAVASVELELTENAEPAGELIVLDIPTALQMALKRRPELEAVRQQLANDDTNVHVATDNLKPDLSLRGFYASNGVGGNQLDTTTGTVTAPGGFVDSLDQVGSFNFPAYGFTMSLRVPIRNRSAQADLGTALISKRNDLYQLRSREQAVNLDVRNAVNQLEESKLAINASKIARDLAKKTLAAEQRKYELGAQTIFFVLDAQNVLGQAEQNYLQSLIGYERALASLDRATGNLLEKNRVIIEDATH